MEQDKALREQYSKNLKIGEEILYLSWQDCQDTGTTVEEIINATEQGMIDYSLKKTEMPAKIGIHPMQDSLMHAMPAYLPDQYACGIKWGSNFPDNRKLFGVTNTNCQIIYNDALTGMPMAIMDATWITELRTPATALVSIKYGGNLDATTWGMIGCGIQGKANVRMIEHMLPKLEKIYIYDVFEQAMDDLIAIDQPQVNAEIVKCSSYEELVKSAEIITSAIPIAHVPNPPVKDEWVSKGQTLVCLDCHTTYEDAVYKRADKYYQDSIEEHALLATYGVYPNGLPTITGETGEAAAGVVPARESKDELVIFNNVGMATEDMMCARIIFDRALEQGLGVKLPMWGSTKGMK